MTKIELAQKIAAETGQELKEVLTTIESFTKQVKLANKFGENVFIRGFGTFGVVRRKEKTARNIGKNTAIVIPAHNAPKFKPSKEFKVN